MYYVEHKDHNYFNNYDRFELVNENKDLIISFLLESGLNDLANEACSEAKFNQPRYVAELAKSAPDHILETLEICGLLYKGYSSSVKRSLKNEM